MKRGCLIMILKIILRQPLHFLSTVRYVKIYRVRSCTHLYFRKRSITHGILPTSSKQVQAYTARGDQCRTKAPSSARGIAIPHIQTTKLYISNHCCQLMGGWINFSVSKKAYKTPKISPDGVKWGRNCVSNLWVSP